MIINLFCVHSLEYAEIMTWDLKVYSCQNVSESLSILEQQVTGKKKEASARRIWEDSAEFLIMSL